MGIIVRGGHITSLDTWDKLILCLGYLIIHSCPVDKQIQIKEITEQGTCTDDANLNKV